MESGKELIEKEIIASIESPDIKEFARRCVDTIPAYFYEVGASSTNKYHPDYAIGHNGLVRHTCALVRFFNHLMGMEMYERTLTDWEKDLLRVACLMHDSRKSGTQEEFEKSKWTAFFHPMYAAEVVRSVSIDGIEVDEKDRELIANAIESHMGQWNVNPKNHEEILPLPSNKYQKMLHMVDYLASRKDVELKFDGFSSEGVQRVTTETSTQEWNIETATFPFGKHKGKLIKEVNEQFPDYIAWCKGNLDDGPLKKLLLTL